MATLKDYRDERLRKLEDLKSLGINPYPAESHRSHNAGEITTRFEELQGQTVTAAGRVIGLRKFGKLAFIVLKDFSGQVQLFLRDGEAAELDAADGILGIKEVPLLDSGDFVEATGEVIKTKTGEISVSVKTLRLLTKSLRPMPTELTNKEERLRRRYVDMNVNQDVRDRFIRRSKFWQATRDYLSQHGFLEINIPVLEHTTGGADANPFVTHMDALDQDFYLRISHELPLKRLIGAGYEKVYDIGPRFRNENYSDEHLPEHIAMEWYWAYANWEQGMRFTKEMIRSIADNTWGTRQFSLMNGMTVDLGEDGEDWPCVSFVDMVREHYAIDVFNCTLEQVQKKIRENNIELEKSDNIGRCIDKLWKKIRIELSGPAFLVDVPAFLQPLAKLQAKDPRLTEQFNLLIGGTEACKAYSELNDPIDQLNRFVEQQQLRDAGDDEAMMLDIDFVEMLEYGMPPACGYGHAERLFWILEGVTAREGVPFPQLRQEVDEVTKQTYPNVYATQESSLKKKGDSRQQDFSKKIIVVVNKELEPWRVANAVAHMSAIIGNETGKQQLTSGDYFISNDEVSIPRNSQYPIIIKRASERDLHTLFENVKRAGLLHHVFIKEMQDTNNDKEIVEKLENQSIADTVFYGVTFFANADEGDTFTKKFQLWE